MTPQEHQVIDASELLPGDRIEDGGSTGHVVKTVRNFKRKTKIRDIHGWDHDLDGAVTVRLPRQSGQGLLR